MLHINSSESVATLGRFFLDSGYTVSELHDRLGLRDLPHPSLNNIQVLLHKTAGEDPLSMLARLFFAGDATPLDRCRRCLPESVIATCLDTGLLDRMDAHVRSRYTLLPFGGAAGSLIVACDAVWARAGNVDVILGPSETTVLLSKFLIQTPSSATLDLGTGTGVLALSAARYSKRVVASDINQRALEFTSFNTALNGIEHLSVFRGDAFEPVAGQQFDRIVANPPFFLSPAKTLTFCDSPMELDGFCRRLVKEAPAYLKEGGFFQMICEWVQVAGQSWEERLKEWTDESGCDIMVLPGPRMTPLDYSAKRLAEARLLLSGQQEEQFTDRLLYFEERRVEAITGGILTMRKRAGSNWFVAVPMTDAPKFDAGAALAARFAAFDYLLTHSETDLLSAKFRFTGSALLEQRSSFGPEGWRTVSAGLREVNGLGDTLGLDTTAASFLGVFDGHRTLAACADAVSTDLSIPLDQARVNCLRLIRRLLRSNFVEPC